jgi:hypothetical protein
MEVERGGWFLLVISKLKTNSRVLSRDPAGLCIYCRWCRSRFTRFGEFSCDMHMSMLQYDKSRAVLGACL